MGFYNQQSIHVPQNNLTFRRAKDTFKFSSSIYTVVIVLIRKSLSTGLNLRNYVLPGNTFTRTNYALYN